MHIFLRMRYFARRKITVSSLVKTLTSAFGRTKTMWCPGDDGFDAAVPKPDREDLASRVRKPWQQSMLNFRVSRAAEGTKTMGRGAASYYNSR